MKSMDLFLIAGQSNAVGYSPIRGEGAEKIDRIFEGFWYAGQTDILLPDAVAASEVTPRDTLGAFVQGVRGGLGRTESCIGPEYGFAETLSPRYDAENPAFIFKTAAGGVSIFDTDGSYSGVYGNWCPPSMRLAEHRTCACGVLYDRFIDNFAAVFRRLVEQDFSPQPQAVLWLQGETDRSSPEAYERHIKALITDMRADLGRITGAETSRLAFVVSGISPTVFGYDTKYKNDRFNDMLRKVAVASPAVYFVDNAADETMWVNDRNGVAVGADRCHYNVAQMHALGMRLAAAVIENKII